jgi:CxxC motif-containing protein (DUF1111 family)
MRKACLFAAALFAMLSQATVVAGSDLSVAIGERMFRRAWTPAPSSTTANDGLGPLFNARSCNACHQGLARVDAFAADALQRGVVIRLSQPDGGGDPLYGRQMQTAAVAGLAPETGGLADLAALSEEAMRAFADPDDQDGDGISGRLAILPDGSIGRFGWKAAHATLQDQVAAAFLLDLGMSTKQHPLPFGDCTAGDQNCRAAPHGADDRGIEIAPVIVEAIAAFLASVPHLATTPKPNEGAKLFQSAQCGACHVPELARTDGKPPVALYSDLLLHDLGNALASGGPEGAALATEWRTAPLRGLGARKSLGLMHDGRAKDIESAILAHAGEANTSRQTFLALDLEQRRALIAFLERL